MTFEQATRTPTFEDVADEQWAELHTQYPPLRVLGYAKADKKRVFATEEQRTHTYIIGSTREGKSKYIEHLIRGDIKRGLGCCLLDPSAEGATVYEVLKYCYKKDFKKVLLIDPSHRFDYGKVPALSPFIYPADKNESGVSDRLKLYSLGIVRDTIRVLFKDDPLTTSRINRYLRSVLTLLYNAQSSINDARYFADRLFAKQREEIMAMTPPLDPARRSVESAFANRLEYENYQSTINRIDPLLTDTLGMMFFPRKGIDFFRLIADRWVILVNLDTTEGFDEVHSKLLGTLIINQIITAIARFNKKLREQGKEHYPPYYLYVDEAGEYIGEKVARTMELRQKTGLRVTIGHQSSDQFEDERIWRRILNVSKTTVQFNLPGAYDRNKMAEQNYGGKIDPKDAAYVNSNLPTQEAELKFLKAEPRRIQAPTVTSVQVDPLQLRNFIMDLYQAHPNWYHDATALERQLNDLYTLPYEHEDSGAPANPKRAPRRTKAHNPSDSKTPPGENAFDRARREGNK